MPRPRGTRRHTQHGHDANNGRPGHSLIDLAGEFDADKFRLAVTQRQDPDGTQLSLDMPRWSFSDDDLADMIAYLKTLP